MNKEEYRLLNINDLYNLEKIQDVESKLMSSLIIGKRGTGKTTLTNDLINKITKINNIDNINIFSFDKDRFDNLHNICVVDNYNTESINLIIENQKKDNSKPVLLVFDDCINLSSKDNSINILKKILVEGKQLKIFTIIVQQFVSFSPLIKNNIDIIYVFKEIFKPNLINIYEYCKKLFDYNIFLYLINKLDNYECIVSYKLNNLQKIGFYKVNI